MKSLSAAAADLHSVEAEMLRDVKRTVAHQQLIGKLASHTRNETHVFMDITIK